VDGVRVLALAVDEAVDGKRVERPESERMAVDDQEGRLFGVWHQDSLQGTRDTRTASTDDGEKGRE
jgi:hypothetical protein